jgi:hypothetical protein
MCGAASFSTAGSGGGGFGFSLDGTSMLNMAASTMRGMAEQRAVRANAEAQIEIGKRRADEEYRRRVTNAIYSMQEADMAQRQANVSAAQSKFEIAREMLRAREEARASASGAGVIGNSVNRILTDISFTEQQKRAVAETNRRNIVQTQQFQKHKAIQSTKMDPFYYTKPGDDSSGIFGSVLGMLPGLFSGFSFSCATPRATTTSSCG